MTKSTNQETIAFYDEPLVCGAAPSIGCGSRAKPLLVDLEQQAPIREAWLNRAGTIVAIVWRDQARMEEVGKPIFERHEIEYTERRDDKQTTGSFRMEGSWLRGAEVDRLQAPRVTLFDVCSGRCGVRPILDSRSTVPLIPKRRPR